jgi:hypothetical protein
VDGIEIRYAGVLLGRATQARDQSPAGLFVGFSEPLPIGTAVSLKSADGERVGKVTDVVESADPAVAGMRVQYRTEARDEPPRAAQEPASSSAAPEPVASSAAPEPASSFTAPESVASSAAPEPVVDAQPSGPANASGAHDGDSGRKKRRRR